MLYLLEDVHAITYLLRLTTVHDVYEEVTWSTSGKHVHKFTPLEAQAQGFEDSTTSEYTLCLWTKVRISLNHYICLSKALSFVVTVGISCTSSSDRHRALLKLSLNSAPTEICE
ncbi:hypothetical protein KP509_15G049300 [Ceratopteris richardii]|uniref:Uncharacterized protein n=1 Tax=Ceratopteris richardii TaxID=49495 RepID=A0A8T2T9A6_CERRI|nr:hypothetical protein KP509_15G049300 [Ceratopteris richardii]